MAKDYNLLKYEAIQRICEAIRESYSVADAIDDESLATNSTFSSVKINKLYSDIDTRVDALEKGGSSGGENVIEVIKVNGVEQIPVDKAVNIIIPTKVSELENDAKYITSDTELRFSVVDGILNVTYDDGGNA